MPQTASSSTIIGACIAIAASILNAVGYTIQKEGHNKLKLYNKTNTKQKKIVGEKTWCIGFSIFLIGGLANAMALYYAPQSLVLPLSAVTLVANTILATQILGEPFHKFSYLGIGLVIIGSTLAVLFGPRTGGEHIGIDVLKERWKNTGFLTFFLFLSILTVIDYVGIKYYERKNHLDENVELKEVKYGKTFLLLSYGFMNGYFGSNAFLFLKAFTEFMGASFSNINDAETALKSWFSYFILITVVLTNVLFVMWQQRGLSYFPSVYMIPINQVTLIIMGTILGGVYFDEFVDFGSVNATMFIIAILLTSLGVIVLAAGNTVFGDMDNLQLPLKVNSVIKDKAQHQNGVHDKLKRVGSLSQDSSTGIAVDNTNADYMSVRDHDSLVHILAD